MSAETVQSFLALAMGFATAGLIATGYQLVADRPASVRLLTRGPSVGAIAAVPMLVFAAPFLITRHIVRAGMSAPQRVELVMTATILAGLWSLMSGRVVIMVVQELIRLIG
ncbi:MAG TPA: hypothetical protein VNR11_20655 [Xanthobacteraceae bacterium]|nr:hypothetical protein [Xanthobacteraceae bacterium]